MKRIVSVSLGSSTRDKQTVVQMLGHEVQLERRGTDGDMARARQMIAELDGQVDAIGLGGIDLYLVCGDRRWVIADAAKLAAAATRTPVVDGSGLKDTLERTTIAMLHEQGELTCGKSPADTKIIMVAAVDRFGMAESLAELGYNCIFGDVIFALRLPLPVRSLGAIKLAATTLLPVLSRLPFRFLYPTGNKQETQSGRSARYFDWADIIAGDFHFIKRNLRIDGKSLTGKTIITNTTTDTDLELLRDLGLNRLITTTPRLEGRSFGTNMMEAAMVAIAGKPVDQMRREDYNAMLQEMNWSPNIDILNPL